MSQPVQRQAQSESRVQAAFRIVHEQQCAPHATVVIERNITEAHARRAGEHRRRCHTGCTRLAELHDREHLGMLGQQTLELRFTGRQRMIAVEIDADGLRAGGKQSIEQLRQQGIAQRPTITPQLALGGTDQHDGLRARRRLQMLLQSQIVGRELHALQQAEIAQQAEQQRHHQSPGQRRREARQRGCSPPDHHCQFPMSRNGAQNPGW